MNPKSTRAIIASASVLGLSSFLAGCGTTATRRATTELSPASSYTEQVASNTRLPVAVHTVTPEYPWEMTRAGISGSVDLHCLVDESGNVQEMTVADASNDLFIKPALAAVKQWTFKPGTRDGMPVAMRVNVPVRFVLRQ